MIQQIQAVAVRHQALTVSLIKCKNPHKTLATRLDERLKTLGIVSQVGLTARRTNELANLSKT